MLPGAAAGGVGGRVAGAVGGGGGRVVDGFDAHPLLV